MQQAATSLYLFLLSSLSRLSCLLPPFYAPSRCRCLFLWLLNCLRESSERQRSEEIIMRCALSYFDLGHVSHNSSAPSPSPPLPGTPPHIWLLLCRFVFVIARESFARSICVEQLIGIGIAGIAPQGSPTITLPYHVFLRTYRKLPQQSRAGSPPLSLTSFVSFSCLLFAILLLLILNSN